MRESLRKVVLAALALGALLVAGLAWWGHRMGREDPRVTCPPGTTQVRDGNTWKMDRSLVIFCRGEAGPEGPERVFDPDGQLRLERTAVRGSLEGVERSYDPGGKLIEERTWKAGREDGLQRRWYPSGVLAAEYVFRDGALVGKGRWWNERGEPLVEDEERHDGASSDAAPPAPPPPTGERLRCRPGTIVGLPLTVQAQDGTLQPLRFPCPPQAGPFVPDRRVTCRLDGAQVILDKPDGTFVWCQDPFGRFHGPQRRWDARGRLETEDDYIYGVPTGTSRSWDAEGRLVREERQPEGEGTFWEYHANGRVANEWPFRDHKPAGIERRWDERGRIVEIKHHRDGDRRRGGAALAPMTAALPPAAGAEPRRPADDPRVGCPRETTQRRYDTIPGGVLSVWCENQDGALHGPAKAWYADGRPMLEQLYAQDRLVKERYWNERGQLERRATR